MNRRNFLKQTGVMAAVLAIPTRKMLGAEKQSRARREERDNTSRVPKYTFACILLRDIITIRKSRSSSCIRFFSSAFVLFQLFNICVFVPRIITGQWQKFTSITRKTVNAYLLDQAIYFTKLYGLGPIINHCCLNKHKNRCLWLRNQPKIELQL